MGEKVFCLYSNKEQEKLLAMAYSEEQISEESQYYSNGVWFEYDAIENSNLIENEKLYKKKVSFPNTPAERPRFTENKEDYRWIR